MVTTITSERNSGKSSEAVNLFLKDLANTIFIVKNNAERNEIEKLVLFIAREQGKLVDSTFLKSNLIVKGKENLIGRKCKNVIVDNFLQQKDYFRFYKDITLISDNIYLFTSYNSDSFFFYGRNSIKESFK